MPGMSELNVDSTQKSLESWACYESLKTHKKQSAIIITLVLFFSSSFVPLSRNCVNLCHVLMAKSLERIWSAKVLLSNVFPYHSSALNGFDKREQCWRDCESWSGDGWMEKSGWKLQNKSNFQKQKIAPVLPTAPSTQRIRKTYSVLPGTEWNMLSRNMIHNKH